MDLWKIGRALLFLNLFLFCENCKRFVLGIKIIAFDYIRRVNVFCNINLIKTLSRYEEGGLSRIFIKY